MPNAEPKRKKPPAWPSAAPASVPTLLLPATRRTKPHTRHASAWWCKRFSASWSGLFTLALVLMLMGCASSPTTLPPEPPPLPAALRQPCPMLPTPADGTGATVLRWAREVVGLYNDCAARHGQLVEAVR